MDQRTIELVAKAILSLPEDKAKQTARALIVGFESLVKGKTIKAEVAENFRKTLNASIRKERSKMERTIIFDGKNGRDNYCCCENCRGGQPVNLPEIGQRLYSTGIVIDHVAHQSACTLFVTADRARAAYVSGSHEPFIPGIVAHPKRVFKRSGFTHLAMCSAGYVEYDCDDLSEVASHLSYYGSRSKIRARLESFGFPSEYIGNLTALIPEDFVEPSEDDLFDENQQYHCWGDIFMMGSSDPGDHPSFLYGWKYGNEVPLVDSRNDEERTWDEIIPLIERGELPRPVFTGLTSSRPYKEISWQGKVWRKDYQACPGKYNWVSTGGKWKAVSDWHLSQ